VCSSDLLKGLPLPILVVPDICGDEWNKKGTPNCLDTRTTKPLLTLQRGAVV